MWSKSSQRIKPPLTPLSTKPPSLSSHFAMIELKQRTLTSLFKLSDKDTHHIAAVDLHNIIETASPDAISMLLNSLYTAAGDNPTINKPSVKKESIRLLAVICATHTVSARSHLAKIIAHIVKRLKDSDSSVREACRESIGRLSFLYLKGEGAENDIGSVVALFVKPLFEAMNEEDKVVQAGSAMCMAKMVEMAANPPVSVFQKLCNRICKYLKNPNFMAKAALLLVVSSLSKVNTISARGLEPLLQCIHDCLLSSDWSTRKAAADTLSTLALHSSNLITGKTASTITVLEACRFDKIKPVRDGVLEALQQWKRIAGPSEDHRTSDHGENSKKNGFSSDHDDSRSAKSEKDFSNVEADEPDASCISRTVITLKKKAPALSDKELNPDFFQKLERRVSGEVEVVIPRRFVNSHNENELELNDTDGGSKSKEGYEPDDGRVNLRHDGQSSRRGELSETNDSSQREGYMSDKGNWFAIQRQLLKLERQQANLMNMLQNSLRGSRDGMVTLENRIRGLEKVIEDMAHDLSVSNNRSSSSYMRGFYKYPNTSMRGSGSSWDYHTYARNTQTDLRWTVDVRSTGR
ncbi:microtubule-associated protein TORTIFOLIA1-like [Cynara cardunculus var. scolymus]|uniref:microtubule-associated protein TORTIFOLIA1-like n=1 Tax=Cynara cardunculus var. scolymus TaxID=59895 RepID=UPI000D6266FF|nr:microtubule-associated protein TORTIFOLIA1-like [Cynara cardunculus var. scolymus]